MTSDVLLVGLGSMGRAYAAVLNALHVRSVAVGRSASGAESFTQSTGINAHSGGLAAWVDRAEAVPRCAIVCVSVEETPAVVYALLQLGIRRILVEKPGATTPREIEILSQNADAVAADIFVAYNRRFYASVAEAQRRAKAE